MFRRRSFESDMDVELGFHVDAYIDDLVRAVLDRTEAKRRTRIEFGAIEATKDECRQAWGLQRMDELRADLRLAFRTLRRNPGFASMLYFPQSWNRGKHGDFWPTGRRHTSDSASARPRPACVRTECWHTGSSAVHPIPLRLLRTKQGFEAMAAFSPSNIESGSMAAATGSRGLRVRQFLQVARHQATDRRALSASDDQTVGRVDRTSGPGDSHVTGSNGSVAISGSGRSIRLFDHSVPSSESASDVMSLEPGRPIDIAVP